MSYIQTFDKIPIWGLFFAVILLFACASELGFRVGKFIHERLGKEQNPMVGTILGASLGLLAFFLAFTFNMAGSRYDVRKNLVLEEASAIEKTYLLATLLPKPYSNEFKELLRKYVNVRAQIQEIDSLDIVPQIINESEELHDQLWAKVIMMTERGDYPVTARLFIRSLNNIFELHNKRVNAGLYNRIPISIFVTLYFVGFLSMTMMGYQAGLSGNRSPVAGFTLIIAFSIVLTLIADLERPHKEIFSVSQQTIVDLKNKIGRLP